MFRRFSRFIPHVLLIGVILSTLVLFTQYGVLGNFEIFVDSATPVTHSEARQMIADDALACEWDTAPFLVVSENVFSPLIYYSHIFPVVGGAILAFLVWRNRQQQLVNNLFVVLAITFITWSLFDLILWADANPNAIMFFWSALIYFDLLIYLSATYLFYVFVTGRDAPPIAKYVAAGLFAPLIVLAPTALNLTGFDYTNCDREAIEGSLWHYVYLVEILITFGMVGYAIYAFKKTLEKAKRIQLALLAIGITLFLFAFSLGNVVGSFSEDWALAQYGLFGMPIFLGIVMYLIVQFHTFRVRVIATSALVVSLWVLLFSVLLLETMESARPVIIITLLFFALMGYLLVISVRREIKQRELIEKQGKGLRSVNETVYKHSLELVRLRRELELANREQESLLHFISHEVKGYLTKSEAGFASIVEGDYGHIPENLKAMSWAALGAVRKGVATVMDILDASNLKNGTVTYKKDRFDFKTAVLEAVEDLRPSADEKNLIINVSISGEDFTMEGDEEKLKRHAVRNLIDNAIKYTPKGAIHIDLFRTDGHFRFSVQDEGVGVTTEDMSNLFTEGGKGKDSVKVNVHSTGYGLYIAKKIVEAHGGRIWAESEGQGKGSRFIVELPGSP